MKNESCRGVACNALTRKIIVLIIKIIALKRKINHLEKKN